MTSWKKGNVPYYKGLYWVTVNEAGKIKLYDTPMRYEGDVVWTLEGHSYHADNIIAWMPCNKPSRPYDENHIGFPNNFYIKTTRDGETMFYSKGLQSVKWSKSGYETKEKAYAAPKRLKKSDAEYGYKDYVYAVVDGDGNEIVL